MKFLRLWINIFLIGILILLAIALFMVVMLFAVWLCVNVSPVLGGLVVLLELSFVIALLCK
jgi:hypothetical protein